MDFKTSRKLKFDEGASIPVAPVNPDIPINSINFKSWFGNSVVRNTDGTPMPVFHSTSFIFDRFKVDHGQNSYRKFGAHFGSIEAATNRVHVRAQELAQNAEPDMGRNPHVMAVYLSIQNPLRLDEVRTGRWGVHDVMMQIMEKGDVGLIDIPEEMLDAFFRDELEIDGQSWTDVHEDEASQLLISFLEKTLGVDGIVYANTFEGGGDSYLVWDPKKIKSASENTGQFDPNDDRITH